MTYLDPEKQGLSAADLGIRPSPWTARLPGVYGTGFPMLAKELKLKDGWDYRKLYLSTGDLAKQYRIKGLKFIQ